ncbi:hypothetical protein F3Y22_tig00000340pilonHSYRG00691 [Hibiscus syriacus]|uniref:Uncharacterized protein n=1 Tax=Hibiscus syriacus TaxID=106335 RepID=A0A6A3D1H1_HIBSY|nr:hypothetical protein F3Y22_tig00000340pilonHSYRG00691 [Hibiscus syriacus]
MVRISSPFFKLLNSELAGSLSNAFDHAIDVFQIGCYFMLGQQNLGEMKGSIEEAALCLPVQVVHVLIDGVFNLVCQVPDTCDPSLLGFTIFTSSIISIHEKVCDCSKKKLHLLNFIGNTS